MRENERYGKSSFLDGYSGCLTNQIYVNGQAGSYTNVDENDSYYHGGVPLKAIAPNWKDYTDDFAHDDECCASGEEKESGEESE